MKKTFLMLAAAGMMLALSPAMATDPVGNCGNGKGTGNACLGGNGGNGGDGGTGGNGGLGGTGGAGGVGYGGTGVGIAGAASNAAAAAAASSSASNHTAVGVVAGGGHSSATGGSASVGGVGNGLGNFSPSSDSKSSVGNVGNNSGNSTNVVVTDVKTGAQTNTQTVDMADNGSTVNAAIEAGKAAIEVAKINNGIREDGTKDRSAEETAIQTALIEAEARIEAARLAQTIKNTPSVSGPPLVSSNDTCMGSTSGSANAPGIGIGFGTTWTESNCVMLKNSRELWNMGMKAASLALMCNDSKNREALELTGFECPQTTKAKQAAAPAAAATAKGEPTDPHVRRRMGLSTLASAQ